MNPDFELSRRGFLGAAGLCLCGGPPPRPPPMLGEGRVGDRPHCEPPPRPDKAPKKLAVVTTAYYYLSHAYHLCGRFLNGYLRDSKMHYPDFGIAGMYVEQQGPNDLSKEHARKHGFPLFPDIASALTPGGDKLAVDGVLLIGEHGDFPMNEKMQKLYPRYEYFQKIVEVFKKSGRAVPVFCDKHLSYDRKKAREMAETARKVGFPLMAGSSLPITWRRPELELTRGCASTALSSHRAARWRFSASTPWSRCNVWWSGGPARSRGSRRCAASKATRCGRRATTACGRGTCWRRRWAEARR